MSSRLSRSVFEGCSTYEVIYDGQEWLRFPLYIHSVNRVGPHETVLIRIFRMQPDL